jgi:hypothetical protein
MGTLSGVVIGALAGLVGFLIADVPVGRRRLEAFARRHALDVTAASAVLVVRYLRANWRWRVAGISAAAAAYLADDMHHQRISINLFYALAGWFVGALIAEVVATPYSASRRVASLDRRSPARYVTPRTRRALWVTSGFCFVTALLAAATNDERWRVPLIGAVLLPAVVVLVARHVAVRAQPMSEPDLIAADEAVRAHSLQALYAAAASLLLYLGLPPILGTIHDPSMLSAAVVVALLAVPIVGWRLATG